MTQLNSSGSSRTTRFDIRIPAHVRDAVEMAANLEGRSLTDFLIGAMLEKAEGVIAAHKRLELSLNDQTMLAQALSQHTSTPNALAKQISEEFRSVVESR